MAHSASLDHRSCARSPRRVLPKDNTEAFERSVFRSEPSLVYAVGELGYDFGSDAVRDAFEHQMCPRSKTRANPDDVRELAEFLSRVRGKEPWHAASLLWTLKMNDAILYVVRPDGPFADEGYKRLCQSLLVRLCGTAVRIVVPGTITAEARLLNGQSVPVVTPDLRGLRTWTIQALDAVASVPVSRDDKDSNDAAPRFWDRVSHELRNEGLRPEDRALNFALTDIFENHSVPAAFGSKGVLDTIDVEKSAICRTGSDCWNVTLAFFAPAQPAQMVRQIYSCTIDVSQSLPVIVGSVRLWKTRARSVDSSRGRVDAFRP